MNRKKIYGLLAVLLLVPVVYLAVLPSSTRAMFFTEFKHNAGLLFGYEPEPVVGADGSSGLRLEHPEEYGPAPGAESESDEETEAEAREQPGEQSGEENTVDESAPSSNESPE